MIRKTPWGFIAGVSAVIAFYATAAIVVLYIVFAGIKGQTNDSATMFDSWYQTLLFVVDVAVILVMTGSSVMAVLVKKGKFGNKTAERENESTAVTEVSDGQAEENI